MTQAANVTAGLMCPPEMWPIAATATAIPSPCAIEIAINLDESRPVSNEPVMTTAPVPMNTERSSEMMGFHSQHQFAIIRRRPAKSTAVLRFGAWLRHQGDALDLRGTKSLENLKEAFARDAQGNRRYLYFARRADIEGHADIGGMFRDICEAETAHAFGDLDFLKQIGDPITDEPIGDTKTNLRAAIASETYDGVEMYPGFAKTAREENFQELAEWFEMLARAEQSHTARLRQALENIS